MPLVEERYDQHKIDNLRRYLQREADKGRPKDYEIIVDGFKVVPRTGDVKEFDDYEPEIRDNTRNVSILLYDGESNRNTKYSFHLNADSLPAQPQNGIGGLGEIDQLIKQRLDEKDRDYQIQSLKEKLDAKQAELDEAMEYHKLQEEEIAQLKAGKFNLNGQNMAEWLGEILKFTVRSNAHRSPAVAQLSAVLGALNGMDQLPDAQQLNRPQETECEVTFREKEASPGVSDSIQQMQAALSGTQLHAVNEILIQLMKYPDQIQMVAELLNIKINQ